MPTRKGKVSGVIRHTYKGKHGAEYKLVQTKPRKPRKKKSGKKSGSKKTTRRGSSRKKK
jgi:hypothetical protein